MAAGDNPCPIRRARPDEAAALAGLIARSFAGVAGRFALNRKNCPSHPSLVTVETMDRALARGTVFLLAAEGDRPCGCIGIRQPRDGLSDLEKLAVDPVDRRRGIGRRLVAAAEAVARDEGAERIRAGIIAEQEELRAWYRSLGFAESEIADFAHLPFRVLYLAKPVSRS